MRNTRFIFVEGIMGSGKSTAVYSLVTHLRREGISARGLWEGPTVDEPDHPLRLGPALSHPKAPWLDLTIEQYIEESLALWRRYVAEIVLSPAVTVCDGLLFHGNMTDLMLMGASFPTLQRYTAEILSVLDALGPVLIYLRRPDVAEALGTIARERGGQWVDYQVSWKLSSPLAVRQGWQNFEGLVEFYVAYREACDLLFGDLEIPKLHIDHKNDWDAVSTCMAAFLDLPTQEQPFTWTRFA